MDQMEGWFHGDVFMVPFGGWIHGEEVEWPYMGGGEGGGGGGENMEDGFS